MQLPYRQRTRAPDRVAPFTFGTVGGQPLRKGFLYLLQAWKQLQLPNARLLLRTDAPLDRSPVLRELLRELPNVEIVRYVENMSDFYRRCDAFVFPTIDDGFGMALLEAMAHGLPAITTTHCGAAELFTPDKDLIVVPAQDAEQSGRPPCNVSIPLRRRVPACGRMPWIRCGALKAMEHITCIQKRWIRSSRCDRMLETDRRAYHFRHAEFNPS